MRIKNIALFLIMGSVIFLACSGDDDSSQNQPQNQPPGNFNLIGVTNTANNVSVMPSFSWNASVDPDGDEVTYDFYLGEDEAASSLFLEDLTGTQLTLENRLKLVTQYYWRVVAKDGNGGETSSEIYSFTTRNLSSGTLLNTAGFPEFRGHTSLVFDGKIWLWVEIEMVALTKKLGLQLTVSTGLLLLTALIFQVE
jgi:leucine-zipper-like transcriptional regulator 1